MSTAWAPAGSEGFNAQLGETLTQLAAAMCEAFGANLVALVLGGGYGRGEGAVQRVNRIERAYNDLDLFAVTSGRPLIGIDDVCRPFADRLGVHVDVGRPLKVADVQAWSPALMWYDLVHGHRVLAGDPDILRANVPAAVRRDLPAFEAGRLLLNRGMGLLWAMRVASGIEPAPADDADFVRRNAFKAMLALGDAPLIAHGRYVAASAGRGTRFTHLSHDDRGVAALGVDAAYQRALRFKIEPDRFPGAISRSELLDLARAWERVLLHVDGVRAGASWANLAEFRGAGDAREPGPNHPRHWPANAARNLLSGRVSMRHPREHLYRELPRLLAGAARPTSAWVDASARALALWRRFQ